MSSFLDAGLRPAFTSNKRYSTRRLQRCPAFKRIVLRSRLMAKLEANSGLRWARWRNSAAIPSRRPFLGPAHLPNFPTRMPRQLKFRLDPDFSFPSSLDIEKLWRTRRKTGYVAGSHHEYLRGRRFCHQTPGSGTVSREAGTALRRGHGQEWHAFDRENVFAPGARPARTAGSAID